MRHLRDIHGISISGSKNKKDLLNMGYYHGYKGYRFIGQSENKIPYNNFNEVAAVYQFDANLKTLFYPNIMLIETAIKNYTLDSLISIGPVDFDYVFAHLLNDYKKHPVGNSKYRTKMKNRLALRDEIYGAISYNYSDQKAVIQHFFHNNKPIPLWAIFEVISLGVFGFFLLCLNESARIKIAQDLNMHSTAHNQDGRILEKIIFLLKELRNAVAHNSVAFDCRFRKTNPPSQVIEYLQSETGVTNIHFKNIVDYFVLVVFLLSKLGINKKELKKLIRNFTAESERLRESIPTSVHASIMGTDFRKKMNQINSYL